MAEELSDERIAEKVKTGDIDAFGILVARYEPRLKRYGRKFLNNSEDVDDIVQEIFIKAYININSFDSARSFSPWIYRIAHNEFVSFLKRNSIKKFFNVDFNTDTFFPQIVAAENTEDESEKRILKSKIETCLNELDTKYKEPIILYYFEDLDYAHISEILHIPVSTVGVRLSRAKKLILALCKKSHANE